LVVGGGPEGKEGRLEKTAPTSGKNMFPFWHPPGYDGPLGGDQPPGGARGAVGGGGSWGGLRGVNVTHFVSLPHWSLSKPCPIGQRRGVPALPGLAGPALSRRPGAPVRGGGGRGSGGPTDCSGDTR